MIGRQRASGDLEGNDSVLNEILFQNVPGGTEENRDKPQHSCCPGRASNQVPSEYDHRALQFETTRLFEVYRTTIWIISCLRKENNSIQLFIFKKNKSS
jgi:hypothetical protein